MDFSGKSVLVVGLARSGRAAIKVLKELGAKVTLSDLKVPDEDLGVEVRDQSLAVAEGDYDLVVKNPGVHNDIPFMERLYERGIPVITEIELAFQVAKPQHFIAITGTNGKTTTSTLCYEILNKAFPGRVHLCGNIGIPLCEIVMNEGLMEREGDFIVGGAWWAAVYGVAQSRTQLKRLCSSSSSSNFNPLSFSCSICALH